MNMGINMEDTKAQRLIRKYSHGDIISVQQALTVDGDTDYREFNADTTDLISDAILAIAEIVVKHEGITNKIDEAHNITYSVLVQVLGAMAMAEQSCQAETFSDPTVQREAEQACANKPLSNRLLKAMLLAKNTTQLKGKIDSYGSLLTTQMTNYMAAYIAKMSNVKTSDLEG